VSPDPEVHTTPAGLRFRLLDGDASPEELEVLALALDRLAALERGGQPSPWASAARPGAGTRAHPTGRGWGSSLRAGPRRP